jgi:hypothetical protein
LILRGRLRCRLGSPIKLHGKRSQTQANHTQANQPAKIRDESQEGEDQQAHQESRTADLPLWSPRTAMLAGSLVNGIVTVTIPEAYNGEFEFLVFVAHANDGRIGKGAYVLAGGPDDSGVAVFGAKNGCSQVASTTITVTKQLSPIRFLPWSLSSEYVRTSMRYQHPGLESIREAIDQRNLRHNPRHSELRVQ